MLDIRLEYDVNDFPPNLLKCFENKKHLLYIEELIKKENLI